MAEKVDVLSKDSEKLENSMIVVFNKPYTFEGEVYKEVDLSALDDMTASDMIAANKILEKTGSFTFLPEMSLEYACLIAARATKMPLQFFQRLHPRDAIKVKNKVTSFFLRRGIRPEDGKNLRKIAIQLAMSLQTGIDYFLSLSVFELIEVAKEVEEIGRKQRTRAGNSNRR